MINLNLSIYGKQIHINNDNMIFVFTPITETLFESTLRCKFKEGTKNHSELLKKLNELAAKIVELTDICNKNETKNHYEVQRF